MNVNKNNNKAVMTLSIIIGVLLLLVAVLSVQVISQTRDDSAFIPNEDIVADTERNVVHIYEIYIVPEEDDTIVEDIPEIFDETIIDEVVTDVVDVVDEIETETVTEPVTETETSVEEVVEETVDTTVNETINETVVEDEVIDDEETYWPVVPSIPEIKDEFIASEPKIDEEEQEPEEDVVPEVEEDEVPEIKENVTTDTEVDVETEPKIEVPTETEEDVKDTVETETETETEEDVTSEPKTEEVEVPENNVNNTVVRETKFSMANGEDVVVTWNDEAVVDDVIHDILYYLLLVEFDGDGETMKLTITGEDCIFYNDRVEYDGVVIGSLQGNIVSENTLVTEMSTSGVTLD